MKIPEDLLELYRTAQAWRHERGSEPRFGSGTVEVLIERIASLTDLQDLRRRIEILERERKAS
jgi:hypothetical protein